MPLRIRGGAAPQTHMFGSMELSFSKGFILFSGAEMPFVFGGYRGTCLDHSSGNRKNGSGKSGKFMET